MRKREHAKEKAMMEIAAENRQLTEPFKRHLDEVEDLKQKLVAHEKVSHGESRKVECIRCTVCLVWCSCPPCAAAARAR